MADDDARIAQLEADLAATRQREAVLLAENAGLRDENTSLCTISAEVLEQQSATAEVLQVIASSPTDLQRVLDAIIDAAARLCDAATGNIRRLREADHRLVRCG